MYSKFNLGIAPKKENEDNGLIEHPILSALGHSTNALILALFLQDNSPKGRKEILERLKKHRSRVEEMHDNDQTVFAPSRILVGRTTVNYWIDELVKNSLLRKEGYDPIKFTLMDSAPLIRSFRSLYPSNRMIGIANSGLSYLF